MSDDDDDGGTDGGHRVGDDVDDGRQYAVGSEGASWHRHGHQQLRRRQHNDNQESLLSAMGEGFHMGSFLN